MPSSRKELQGPRPQPLKVGKDSWKVVKKPVASSEERRQPVIVHLHSPKIIHTRPQDFMSLVQQLTGKSPSSSSPPRRLRFDRVACPRDEAKEANSSRSTQDGGVDGGGVDPLVLTLGQFPPIHSSTDLSPSPMSPSLFLCSPNTQQFLHEFTSLI